MALRITLAVAALLFLADQASKHAVVLGMGLIERGVIEVLPPWLTFQMAWNRGVNFGLFANDSAIGQWGLVSLSVIVSVVLAIWAGRGKGVLVPVCAGAIIGGALGNALDRVRYGAVADFLNMSCCGIVNPYSFNIADIAIFAGALGLIAVSGKPRGA